MTPGPNESWSLADLVTRLRRVLRRSVRSDIPWEGLPMAQVELMQRLADEPGLRISELADRHRLAANTVSTLIQQMVVSGLAERAEDPRDRRASIVRLTDDGTRQLAAWQAANRLRIDAALSSVSAKDRQAIERALPALARLVDALEQADEG